MKVDLTQIEPNEIMPGFRGRFVHLEQYTQAYWEISAGSELPEHSHVNEQTSQVIEGEFEMTIGGETNVFKPGMIAKIDSNVVHSGKALTDCKIIDVFAPMRPEYTNS